MKTKGCVLGAWAAVTLFYCLIASGWIAASMHDKAFNDYMTFVVDLAATEHRPAKEIRSLLLVKADSLSIPLQGQQIEISGEGRTLRAVVEYETDLRIALLNRRLYRMKFTHDISYKQPR